MTISLALSAATPHPQPVLLDYLWCLQMLHAFGGLILIGMHIFLLAPPGSPSRNSSLWCSAYNHPNALPLTLCYAFL